MSSPPPPYLAAAVQFEARLYDAKWNRETTADLIRQAASKGAQLVVLPELAISGYGLHSSRLRTLAEPIDGPSVSLWTALARELGVVISGGFCETSGGQLFNTAVITTPAGELTHYRKLHLFDEEKEMFAPGDLGLQVAKTELGAIGLCVCYDLRFVEVTRALALMGADVIAVPTAWVGGFDKNPRDAMGFIGQARGAVVQANLSQVAMVCASQSGANDEFTFLGSSLIIDSFGNCVAGPAQADESETLFGLLDVATIRSSRVRGPRIKPREDRRTDVYRLGVGSKQL